MNPNCSPLRGPGIEVSGLLPLLQTSALPLCAPSAPHPAVAVQQRLTVAADRIARRDGAPTDRADNLGARDVLYAAIRPKQDVLAWLHRHATDGASGELGSHRAKIIQSTGSLVKIPAVRAIAQRRHAPRDRLRKTPAGRRCVHSRSTLGSISRPPLYPPSSTPRRSSHRRRFPQGSGGTPTRPRRSQTRSRRKIQAHHLEGTGRASGGRLR